MSANPDPSPRGSASPSIARRLLASSAGLALSVVLAVGAAHFYELPHLVGSVAPSAWREPDFLFSVASAVVAVAVGGASSRVATRAGAIAAGSPFVRVVLWAAFTVLSFLVWVDSIRLFALLVAPAHGYATLRVLGLWSKWRADATWARRS